jgi:DNA modification methylase
MQANDLQTQTLPALDPSAGSGSTLFACEPVGRCSCLSELDRHYCDAIAERIRRTAGWERRRKR